MKVTVIIPTYRRPQDLSRCLEGLKKQVESIDEMILTVRDTDLQTWTFLETFTPDTLPLNILTVTGSGVIIALNIALKAARGDIIVITDDDAVPHPDWLERIKTHFLLDNRVGGVGGRDFVYINGQLKEGSQHNVGQVQWFGRVIGNHHLGVGTAREVDVLKGVNMSFRRSAIMNKYFNLELRGTGAQVHFELEFCLRLRRENWKLIYDPEIKVNHYPGTRFDEDRRSQFNKVACINRVHNETVALLNFLPLTRQCIFVIWSICIGTKNSLGFLQMLRFLPTQRELAIEKLLASLQGRWQGWKTWKNSKTSSLSSNFSTQNSSR